MIELYHFYTLIHIHDLLRFAWKTSRWGRLSVLVSLDKCTKGMLKNTSFKGIQWVSVKLYPSLLSSYSFLFALMQKETKKINPDISGWWKIAKMMFIWLKIPKLVLRCNAHAHSDKGIFYASFPSFLNAIFHRPLIQVGALSRVSVRYSIFSARRCKLNLDSIAESENSLMMGQLR